MAVSISLNWCFKQKALNWFFVDKSIEIMGYPLFGVWFFCKKLFKELANF
jgi:hypothetical protein